LNQKLVTKKNRKVRLLRELYPDVKCKIFYQRDYLNLLIKYGLERPSQDADLIPEQAPTAGGFGDLLASEPQAQSK
jgi:hypoxanthine phosphoribosyltransferase